MSILYIFKDNDQHVQLGEGRVRVPAIPAGGQQMVSIPVSVRSVISSGERKIKFRGDQMVLQLRWKSASSGVSIIASAPACSTPCLPLGKPVVGAVLQQPKVSVVAHQQVSLKVCNSP